MRVLAFLVVSALVSGPGEGRLVSKCELRSRLTEAIGRLPEDERQRGLTVENLVAKIVCQVERASGFNTSAVNHWSPSRGKRDLHYAGLFSQQLDVHLSTPAPPSRVRRHAETSPTLETPPAFEDERGWRLYGLFQLSDHLVCNDGVTPSPDICGISCRDLMDDDIADDVGCLLRILVSLVNDGFSSAHLEVFKKMIWLIFPSVCLANEAPDYFAECG